MVHCGGGGGGGDYDKLNEVMFERQLKNSVLWKWMMMRLWLTAVCLNDGTENGQVAKLISHSRLTKGDFCKEPTVPSLKMTVNNNDHTMHDHMEGNILSPLWVRHQLREYLNGQKLKTLVLDPGWKLMSGDDFKMKNMTTGNDIVTKITNRHLMAHETVIAESIEAFFDDVIPMLGRLSHFEEHGQIFVPHTPQFMACVYQKEERHRPMFDIEIVE